MQEGNINKMSVRLLVATNNQKTLDTKTHSQREIQRRDNEQTTPWLVLYHLFHENTTSSIYFFQVCFATGLLNDENQEGGRLTKL
jgi:hypothetical protein